MSVRVNVAYIDENCSVVGGLSRAVAALPPETIRWRHLALNLTQTWMTSATLVTLARTLGGPTNFPLLERLGPGVGGGFRRPPQHQLVLAQNEKLRPTGIVDGLGAGWLPPRCTTLLLDVTDTGTTEAALERLLGTLRDVPRLTLVRSAR